MNELISINSSTKTMTSLDIAELSQQKSISQRFAELSQQSNA